MLVPEIDFRKYHNVINDNLFKLKGRVVNVVGLTIESAGPSAKLGDICMVNPGTGNAHDTLTPAEVVGFREGMTLLMPYQEIEGIGPGSSVENTGESLKVRVDDGMLGQILDGFGRPTEGERLTGEEYPVEAAPPEAMSRKIISDVLTLGVKAVDGLITVGKGQRIGIFAGSGVGKSTLMGMFARNTKADVNVIALIGERGREVREFIERDLGPEGMQRSVVVVATSDKPALERKKAAQTATAIAEYFRDQGKDVLLMMDNLTRFCMAQREIGLASGEPPVTRGYPPSVYSEMPKILDGHIMLNRKLAHKNHYPAVDVLQSISRCMSQVADREHKAYAGRLKNVLATYNEAEDLINIGAYKAGSNPGIDYAIQKIQEVNEFLMQEVNEKFTFEDTLVLLRGIFDEGPKD